MKNVAPYIREGLVTLLNNTITYDAQLIPAYSGEGEVRAYQIIIASQNGNPDNNYRDAFVNGFEQVIEIVSEQANNTNSHVDAIGEQTMALITPTRQATGLADSADFITVNARLIGQTYLGEPSGEGTFINRLILRYSFLITQL